MKINVCWRFFFFFVLISAREHSASNLHIFPRHCSRAKGCSLQKLTDNDRNDECRFISLTMPWFLFYEFHASHTQIGAPKKNWAHFKSSRRINKSREYTTENPSTNIPTIIRFSSSFRFFFCEPIKLPLSITSNIFQHIIFIGTE